jgi:predicted HTH transcriptional regulator
MKIVEFMVENEKIKNKDIRKMFGFSHTSAQREISKLIELGVIQRKGQGRSIHYVLI